MDWQTGDTRPAIAESCTASGARQTWLLWGDSYAQALSPGLRAIAPAGTAVAQIATSQCRPSLGELDAEVAGGRCLRASAFALERIAALRPAVVVMAQMDNHLQTDWLALSERLVALGVERVLLVGPVPRWRPSLPEVVTAHYWDSPVSKVAQGLDPDLAGIDRTLKARAEGMGSDGDGCVGVLPGSTDRDLLAFDAGHLTPKGSLYVAEEVLRPWLLAR